MVNFPAENGFIWKILMKIINAPVYHDHSEACTVRYRQLQNTKLFRTSKRLDRFN